MNAPMCRPTSEIDHQSSIIPRSFLDHSSTIPDSCQMSALPLRKLLTHGFQAAWTPDDSALILLDFTSGIQRLDHSSTIPRPNLDQSTTIPRPMLDNTIFMLSREAIHKHSSQILSHAPIVFRRLICSPSSTRRSEVNRLDHSSTILDQDSNTKTSK